MSDDITVDTIPGCTGDICGPATVNLPPIDDGQDNCLDLGNGLGGQTSRSMQPCQLPGQSTSAPVTPAPVTEPPVTIVFDTGSVWQPVATVAAAPPVTLGAQLPATGTFSAPIFGMSAIACLLGGILCRVARRKVVRA
jgi:hypothetical protein